MTRGCIFRPCCVQSTRNRKDFRRVRSIVPRREIAEPRNPGGFRNDVSIDVLRKRLGLRPAQVPQTSRLTRIEALASALEYYSSCACLLRSIRTERFEWMFR